MKTIKLSLTLFAAVWILAACDSNTYGNFPSGPTEYVYDTIDCTGLDIPANAITVREALKIGKNIGSGGVSSETYYVKGIVTGFNNSLDKDKNPLHDYGMLNYGNGYFYIQDNLDINASFYCYRTYGLNGTGFKSLDQVQVGDFVVVKCQINNYNGTIETYWKSGNASYLVYSSNDLVYPVGKYDYLQADFTLGLGDWSQTTKGGLLSNNWDTYTINDITGVCALNPDSLSGETWLISPLINVGKSHPEPVRLAFSHYYLSTTGQDQVKNYLRAKVRNNAGQWTDLEINNFSNGKRKVYASDTLDITDYADGKIQVAFAYKSEWTDQFMFIPSWYITSISVLENKHIR